MKRSSLQISMIERRYSKPLKEVIKELWNKHRSLKLVALELGVSEPAVSYWLYREGLVLETTLKEV